MGRAYVVVASGIAPRLQGSHEGENDLEHEHTDDERAAAGDVGGDRAWVNAEDGDVGENGIDGETALEFPAALSVNWGK